MCFFITIVSAAAGERRLRRGLPAEMRLAEQQNPMLRAHIGGEPLWTLTLGGCSCDLFTTQPREPKQHKLGKRGWSKAKIQRAIEQAMSAPRAKRRAFTGLRQDVRSAISNAAPIGFFVHWYSGDVRNEHFELGAPVAITSAELATGTLTIEVDRWYRLVPPPSQSSQR
jgi:hypothetical protein